MGNQNKHFRIVPIEGTCKQCGNEIKIDVEVDTNETWKNAKKEGRIDGLYEIKNYLESVEDSGVSITRKETLSMINDTLKKLEHEE